VPALLLCESTQLNIERCTFRMHQTLTPSDAPQPKPVGIAWKPPATSRKTTNGMTEPAESSRIEMAISIQDCTFVGNATAIYLRTAPSTLMITNTLKAGAGALCNVPLDRAAEELRCQLQGVTLRDSHSLMRLRVSPAAERVLQIAATRCVFDVRSTGALFEVLANAPPNAVGHLVEVTGDACLAPVGVEVARWLQNSAPGTSWPGDIAIEGISVGPFTFVGDTLPRAADSELHEFQRPPRITSSVQEDRRPGIDASRLLR
jgi:hypothetical protein